jgi:hypothetical protein
MTVHRCHHVRQPLPRLPPHLYWGRYDDPELRVSALEAGFAVGDTLEGNPC